MKKKSLVIDTSIAIKWINSQDEELLEEATQIMKDVQKNNLTLVMPELAKYEVGNALL